MQLHHRAAAPNLTDTLARQVRGSPNLTDTLARQVRGSPNLIDTLAPGAWVAESHELFPVAPCCTKSSKWVCSRPKSAPSVLVCPASRRLCAYRSEKQAANDLGAHHRCTEPDHRPRLAFALLVPRAEKNVLMDRWVSGYGISGHASAHFK
jgi:hypothetical protein